MKKYSQLKADIILDFYLDEICKFRNYKKSDVLKKGRKREYEDIRHIAIFLAKKQFPKMVLKEVSNFFGLEGHSTIVHCLIKIENLKNQDWDIKRTLEHCEKLDFDSELLKSYGFAKENRYWFATTEFSNVVAVSKTSENKYMCSLEFFNTGPFFIEDIDVFDAIIISKNINANPLGFLINSLKN